MFARVLREALVKLRGKMIRAGRPDVRAGYARLYSTCSMIIYTHRLEMEPPTAHACRSRIWKGPGVISRHWDITPPSDPAPALLLLPHYHALHMHILYSSFISYSSEGRVSIAPFTRGFQLASGCNQNSNPPLKVRFEYEFFPIQCDWK